MKTAQIALALVVFMSVSAHAASTANADNASKDKVPAPYSCLCHANDPQGTDSVAGIELKGFKAAVPIQQKGIRNDSRAQTRTLVPCTKYIQADLILIQPPKKGVQSNQMFQASLRLLQVGSADSEPVVIAEGVTHFEKQTPPEFFKLVQRLDDSNIAVSCHR